MNDAPEFESHPFLANGDLLNTIRGGLGCFLTVAAVVLVCLYVSDNARITRESIRGFSPAILASLFLDSMSSCIDKPPRDATAAQNSLKGAANRDALDPNNRIAPSTAFAPVAVTGAPRGANADLNLQLSSSGLLNPNTPCATEPILGDWPHTKHWGAATSWGVLKFIFAGFDITYNITIEPARSGQYLISLISILELAFGVSVAAIIFAKITASQPPRGDLGDIIMVIAYFATFPLAVGLTTIWAAFNLFAFLVYALDPIMPKIKDTGSFIAIGLLTAQCTAAGYFLKKLSVENPRDWLTDRLGRLFGLS